MALRNTDHLSLVKAINDIQDFTNGVPDVSAATAYTLVEDDWGHIKEFSSGSPVTVTLDAALPVGFSCLVCQAGAGTVSLAAGSGATLRQVDSLTDLSGQWAEVSVRVRANTDGASAEWVATGAMA